MQNPEDHPMMESLTPEEKEGFLARVRAEGRILTSEEQYALFGPPKERPADVPIIDVETVEEMEAAPLGEAQISDLQKNFFPEIGDTDEIPYQRLVQGIIFDFDHTLAQLARPVDEFMEEGAKQAEAYMRSTGMEFPENFWNNIMEARRFAQEKSEEEQEEHIADDAMSFLLQFFGYPASKMDREVLKRAVDIFYAPEMTAWVPAPNAIQTLKVLHESGYKLAILANYNCDRVFQRMVDYTGFRPYLDVCVSSASVEYRKPDEKLFNIVLERWDALPYEIVVVGDSLLHDIKGGIELGTLTVQCQTGTSPQVEHDNAQVTDEITPDVIIDDLAQLPALINEWADPLPR